MHKTFLNRLLALAVALMMIGAGIAEETAADETVTYDIIYSTSNPIPQIAAATRPAVVLVTASVESWDATTRVASVTPYSSGSASYIRAMDEGEGGYLLTNYHVVEGCDVFSATWLDGTETELELVGYDDGTDIAILSFKDPAPEGVTPIPLGDSDALQIGELAICIGNPGSGDDVLFGTVTAGIISGLEREGINANNFSRSVSVIQTDAALNTGNSGGALLNAKGELVGIPTLKMGVSYTTVYEGLNFCVPINTIKDFIDQLIENGKVVRPRMGITVTTNDGPDEPMRKFRPCGALVYSVEPGTPAAKAGLQVNDVITEANGVRVHSSTELVAQVDRVGEDGIMKLKVYRYALDTEGNIAGGYEELDIELALEIID